MREFTLAGFGDFLMRLPIAVTIEQHRALEEAAVVVETEAKAEIGTYQGDAGPFPAWQPLAPSTVEEKTKLGYAPPDNPLLREGDMRDSIEHTVVSPHEAQVGSNSDIAVYQELGTVTIPARSFLGGAAHRKGPEVAEIIGGRVVKALTGGAMGHTPKQIP